MAFGVFDGLHEGHKHFLDIAQSKCDELVIVVTPTEIVELLKKKSPRYAFEERASAVSLQNPKAKIVSGDLTLGEWAVVKTHQPDIVFLGHDQHGIASELEKIKMPFVFIEAHFPEKFKSSILNQ